jgi:hypothetical protein
MVRVERRVGRQLDVEQQRTEKEVGAAPRVQQHGAPAEPAEPRPLRQLPLQHRPGVDVGSRLRQIPTELGLQPSEKRQQLLLHHPVVVTASGVAGDDAAGSVGDVGVVARIVVECDDDCGAEPLRIQPPRDGILPRQVLHGTVPAGLDPRTVQRGVVARTHLRDAGRVEAQSQRLSLQRPGERLRVAGSMVCRIRHDTMIRHRGRNDRITPGRDPGLELGQTPAFDPADLGAVADLVFDPGTGALPRPPSLLRGDRFGPARNISPATG